MNSTLNKAHLSFEERILTITFYENTVIDVEDIIYIYCYAQEQAKGRSYGVLFDSSPKHELTEEAVVYFAHSSHLHNVIAIAYISKDLISKIRLSLLLIFERPPLKPKLFDDENTGFLWLKQQLQHAPLVS